MTKYRRRPTVIEAVQRDGTYQSTRDIRALGADVRVPPDLEKPLRLRAGKGGAQGWVDVPLGHWIAKAAEDDFYPIDPDVFAATYEAAE